MAFLRLHAPRGAGLQLVATLGPASQSLAGELAAAGATAFRLNASHLEPTGLQAALRSLRDQLPDAPVVVDLQGAKMRLGRFDAIDVRPGEGVDLAPTSGEDGALPLPHPELFAAARPGETLSLDDGRVRLRILAASPRRLECAALCAGRLEPRKGANLLEHPVALGELTASDRAMAAVAARHSGVAFAFSFMTDGREADWLRRLHPDVPVVGKVERREAVDCLAALAGRVDAIWICRGDLGVQLGLAGLARVVGALAPVSLPVPVLMAGQVLEHLTRHPDPTRSEVCHLHDLLARGYAGLVLSDETAIGDDPARAVAEAARLLRSFA